jgi:hypothetical protein
MEMPATSFGGATAATEIAKIDMFLRNGWDGVLFTHFTPATNRVVFTQVIEYLCDQIGAGLCTSPTMAECYRQWQLRLPYPA